MNRIIEKMDVNPEFLSQVTNKIKEKTGKTEESREYTVEDLRIALGLKPIEIK